MGVPKGTKNKKFSVALIGGTDNVSEKPITTMLSWLHGGFEDGEASISSVAAYPILYLSFFY